MIAFQLVDTPTFEPRFIPNVRDIRIDRISMSFTLAWCGTNCSREANDEFKEIARRSDILRNSGSDSHPALIFREKRDPKLIINGEIRYMNTGRGGAIIKVFIIMNVTEYFTNNPRNRRPHSHKPAYQTRLEAYEPALLRSSSVTLDQRRNFVPNSRQREAETISWAGLAYRMYMDVAALLTHHLSSVTPSGFLNFSDNFPTDWCIRELEIYQEYEHPDAMLFVKVFAPHCQCYFPKRTKKHYPSEDADYLVSYRFPTEKRGVGFSIYAKSENRVRIECEYKLPKTNLHREMNNRLFPSNRNCSFEGALQHLINKTPTLFQPFQNAEASFNNEELGRVHEILDVLSLFPIATNGNKTVMRQVINFIYSQGKLRGGINKQIDEFIVLAEGNLLIGHRKRRNKPKEYTPSPAFKAMVDRIMSSGSARN